MALIPASGYGSQYQNDLSMPRNASTNVGNGMVYQPGIGQFPVGAVPPGGMGNILGASTGPTSPTSGTYNAPAPAQTGPAPAQQQQPTQDPMAAYFDQAAGQLGETQKNLEAQVNSLFSGSQSTINTAQAGSLAELGTAKEKVAANSATSLRDLSKSMRNQLETGAQKLGGIPGASNSTGANMYNYALGKVGNQNRANLMKQTNELNSNIDLQVNKVKQTAQDQLAQLESWKNTQLLQISQYIQQQRGAIDQAKAQQIYSQLQNIDTQANAFKQSLYQWAMNNSTTLDQLKQKLAGFSQGNPTDVAQQGFPQIEYGPTTGNMGDQQVGLWNQKKTPGQPQYLA